MGNGNGMKGKESGRASGGGELAPTVAASQTTPAAVTSAASLNRRRHPETGRAAIARVGAAVDMGGRYRVGADGGRVTSALT